MATPRPGPAPGSDRVGGSRIFRTSCWWPQLRCSGWVQAWVRRCRRCGRVACGANVKRGPWRSVWRCRRVADAPASVCEVFAEPVSGSVRVAVAASLCHVPRQPDTARSSRVSTRVCVVAGTRHGWLIGRNCAFGGTWRRCCAIVLCYRRCTALSRTGTRYAQDARPALPAESCRRGW